MPRTLYAAKSDGLYFQPGTPLLVRRPRGRSVAIGKSGDTGGALGDDSSWLAVAMRYRNRAAQALCANGLLLEAEKAEREGWNINDYTDFFDRKDLPRPYAFLGW